MFTEYNNPTASTAITWDYEYGTACTGSDNNAGKYTNNTTGTLPATLATSNYRRPNLGFNYTEPPCIDPPTAGSTQSSVSTICSNANFDLTLSGNTMGNGQTYKWQQSTTGNAPWTDVDTANTTPLYTTTQGVNTYYRCAVTCSGNTAYSDSIQITTPALVNGTFTIDSTGGGDFFSLYDAFNYIVCGVNGAVTFNIAPGSGPYTLPTQLMINAVYGTSASNTITINGNGETFNYNTTVSAERSAIVLNGIDYLIIDSLNIDVSAGTYGFGIQLMNNSDYNIIRNCTITSNTSSTSTNYAGIVMSSSLTSATTAGSNGSNNLIENNRIVGGYYGITVVGSSSNLDSNNIVRNNSIEDFNYYGIYTSYQNNNSVQYNEIHRPLRSTTSTFCYAIYATTGNEGSNIDGNKIHNMFNSQNTSTNTFYGIYVSSDGTAVSPNKLTNNLIYNNEGNGTHYGIYNTGGEYMQAYHNTIALDYTAA
ncbi:MAG: right-handed parallel beta-helix repeat-containing protein, partial [Chitinophagaceae bacterium]|nr:right-handed parallel beta-helix repeat-containing protein [Chitinophagaceae bacterium]